MYTLQICYMLPTKHNVYSEQSDLLKEALLVLSTTQLLSTEDSTKNLYSEHTLSTEEYTLLHKCYLLTTELHGLKMLSTEDRTMCIFCRKMIY